MSLPTCPSCGQSVLDDDAIDCPFCGAAMDGSRGAKNTPRPKANPVAGRFGARKTPESPSTPAFTAPSSAPAEPAKPVSRPVTVGRPGKTKVDEDDPFGIGKAATGSQALQATVRPEKGRLLKVVCPMCEQVGFVPKNAIGKSVRCANEKCMVPIFTATDPDEQENERKPARLSDEAEAARRAAEAAVPKKRNPLMMYGIVGAVLLAITLVLLPILTKAPDTSALNQPVDINFVPDEEETAQNDQEALEKAKAAADAANPKFEVAAHVKRMITLARQPNLRDKAWARRMTGDLYLRLGELASASQEFNQLLVVNRSQGFYRIDPYLTRYWRSVGAGDQQAAEKSLADALADVPSLPGSGRTDRESAIGLSAVLFHAGRTDQAKGLIAARYLDPTITANRDLLASTAWAFVAASCREASIDCPAVLDTLLWIDPLSTAVAADLAVHDQWAQAIDWAKSLSGSRAITDSLVTIADLAMLRKAPAEVMNQIEAAAPANDASGLLRVRAAVAAASADQAKLESIMTSLSQLPAGSPMAMPPAAEMVQRGVADHTAVQYQSMAVAEVVKAATHLGQAAQAAAAMARLESDLAAVAPPTAELRTLQSQIDRNPDGFQRQLGQELSVSTPSQLDPLFRRYRRNLDALSTDAEDRRLLKVLLVSRIIRAGGVAVVQQIMMTSATLKQELLLDDLSGLLAVGAMQTGQQFPEVFAPDPAMQNGRPRHGHGQFVVDIARIAAQAWANRDQRLPECLKVLETGAGTDLPGFRQALQCELIAFVAESCAEPDGLLAAVSQLQNGIWREEGYLIAGRIFADRKLDKKAEAFMAGARMPQMDQITLLYSMSRGILKRPIPLPPESSDKGSATGQAAAGD